MTSMNNGNDERFDAFLRKNAPKAPEAAAWEKQKIWREIEARGLVQKPRNALSFFRIPKWAAALTAAAVLVVAGSTYRHFEREAEINRVLAEILTGEFEDSAADRILF